MHKLILVSFVVAIATLSSVEGHGRFIKPPNRSSIWRFPEYASQNPVPNYTDNELFCGGIHQADDPGSNCGVCGDALASPAPRANEHGGTYANGIITGRYNAGQEIDVEVELTAAHLGFMQWRLCTNKRTETQACFNQHLLQLANGSGTKLPVDNGTGFYQTRLRLPAGVTCSECVIQWNYRSGNTWGQCEDGSFASGCGPQETFRGCSDVVIN